MQEIKNGDLVYDWQITYHNNNCPRSINITTRGITYSKAKQEGLRNKDIEELHTMEEIDLMRFILDDIDISSEHWQSYAMTLIDFINEEW